ncbi:MAG: hypothetical protein WC445_01490 [Patescibacteria group bacterium]
MSKLPGRQEEGKIPSWFLDGQGQIGCTAIGGNPPSTLLHIPPVLEGVDVEQAWWPKNGLGGDYELLPWLTRPI